MTSSLVIANLPFLELLSCKQCSKEQIRLMLKTITRSQMKAIREIILNVIKGSIPLQRDEKDKLQQYAGNLRLLAKKTTTFKKSKELIGLPLLKVLINITLPYIKRSMYNE